MQEHSFGTWLKLRRKALDLTQAELANQVGCSAAAIRKIEAEERRPSAQIAERLAEIFSVPQNERATFLRFARGELRAAPAGTEKDFPWHRATKPTRSNLPATITSLIGRQQEIARVHEYLLNPDIRLVTLIGPPGIGKTRLSIEAARTVLPDFSDGVFFVALTPLEDSSLLAPTIVQALEYRETKGQPAGQHLPDGIGDKQMLIVMDNCEHLVEDIATLASQLLSACSRLKILATSRESLRVSGEWLYAIPALNVPRENPSIDIETASAFPALTLFAERARAVRYDFSLDAGNIHAVASICAQLDGLPLAIELMAARMRLMTPQALLEHLNSQFILSADGMRSISTRQKTLQDAIAWSYNLLSEEEQSLFAYLSIFSGGFSLEAAETIFSEMFAGKSISDLITSLFDKSLLQRAFDTRGEIRFSMLVTIQQFALNRLQKMGNEAQARDKHFAYFLDLAERADKELRGSNQLEWLHRLEALRDNLRAALEWAIQMRETKLALQLARKLDWFWFVRSDHTEGRQWLQRVLALHDAPLYPELYAEALTQLAHHTWLQVGAEDARAPAEQALQVARAHNDTWNTAKALAILGLVLTDEDNFSAAQAALEQSQRLYQEVHDRWGYAHAVTCLGQVFHRWGDQATALSLREQALMLFRELGDRYFESATLGYIGMVQLKQGNLTRGTAALRESLILAQQLESKYEIAMFLTSFAEVAWLQNNPRRTVHLYLAARNIYESIGAWQKSEETKFENILAPCRAAFGEAAFADAVEQGRAMTMEQAIEYALEQNP